MFGGFHSNQKSDETSGPIVSIERIDVDGYATVTHWTAWV